MKEILDKKDVLDKLKALLSYAIIVDTSIPINENEGIGMGDIVQEIDDMDSLDPAVDLKESFAKAQDEPDWKSLHLILLQRTKRVMLGTPAIDLLDIVTEHYKIRKQARHTSPGAEKEKPEVKDDSNK